MEQRHALHDRTTPVLSAQCSHRSRPQHCYPGGKVSVSGSLQASGTDYGPQDGRASLRLQGGSEGKRERSLKEAQRAFDLPLQSASQMPG